MNSDLNIRLFLWMILICVLALAVFVFTKGMGSNKVMFVVCDVGNGDALYIRSSRGVDIVVDFGSGADILDCLGKHMATLDKTIELAMISHQHFDHYGGLGDVLRIYRIHQLAVPRGPPPSNSYEQAVSTATAKGVRILDATSLVDAHKRIVLGHNEYIECVWPTLADVRILPPKERKDPNAYSLICVYVFGHSRFVLTGDATPHALTKVSLQNQVRPEHITLLKVPHHGSVQGLTATFLATLHAEEAVISVGRENSYGHPSREVLSMLRKAGVPTRMTAREGSVSYAISSDGTFSVR